MVGKPEVIRVGPIGNDKSASVELSRKLGSVRCMQILLAVHKSRSGKSSGRSQFHLDLNSDNRTSPRFGPPNEPPVRFR